MGHYYSYYYVITDLQVSMRSPMPQASLKVVALAEGKNSSASATISA